ncbi:MAG: hypothetical protein U0457_05640 [Candidatus Sericytochromatia bacterium]
MDKKPKLLNKKRILLSGKSSLNTKIFEQAIKSIDVEELINEDEMVKFLTKIFLLEPKLIVLAHEKLEDNLEFAKHVRNNQNFNNVPILAISAPLKKDSIIINKKITDLNIKYFYVPCNVPELSRNINEILEA